jgi:hypothetical protein
MAQIGFNQTSRTPPRLRKSAPLAVAVLIFVVIGMAMEITFLPKASASGVATASTTTTTSTSLYCSEGCPTPSSPIMNAVDAWVQDFNARNVEALSNFYGSDATVAWSGAGVWFDTASGVAAGGSSLAGRYDGAPNVKILYASSIGKTSTLNASISNYDESAINADNVNVTMTINLNGSSLYVGTIKAVVLASQEWQYGGGQWQIVRENWNYQTFGVEFPVASNSP